MGTIKTHTKNGQPLAHPQFYADDGKRLPSVTTVAKAVGGDQGGLLYWANKCGLDGLTLDDARRLPSDVGTYAHHAIEASIKGQPFDIAKLKLDEEQEQLVLASVAEWARWRDQCHLEIVASETPLISDAGRFGGVIDCVARINGQLAIVDWKTGSRIYKEALLQVVAYGALWKENRGDEVQEYHLLRLGKEDASFHHHSWRASSPACVLAWQMFQTALVVHPAMDRLENLVA